MDIEFNDKKPTEVDKLEWVTPQMIVFSIDETQSGGQAFFEDLNGHFMS